MSSSSSRSISWTTHSLSAGSSPLWWSSFPTEMSRPEFDVEGERRCVDSKIRGAGVRGDVGAGVATGVLKRQWREFRSSTNRHHRTRSTIDWRNGSQTLGGQHTTAPPHPQSSQPCLCHSEESRCAYNATSSVSISWSMGGVPTRLQPQEFGRFPCWSVGTKASSHGFHH